jgi:uncharacterized membrane protein YgdD (TMEM256/DUF423 family)
MVRVWLILAAVNGFISVAAGAFAAHGLKGKLEPRMFEIFETGARYQMYHALALLAVAWVAARSPSTVTTAAGACFVGGIVLFSLSLYALSLTGVTKLGVITPFGGVLFLLGWACLAAAGWRLAGL